jgi:hypothetical protein
MSPEERAKAAIETWMKKPYEPDGSGRRGCNTWDLPEHVAAAIRGAVAEERQRCAAAARAACDEVVAGNLNISEWAGDALRKMVREIGSPCGD